MKKYLIPAVALTMALSGQPAQAQFFEFSDPFDEMMSVMSFPPRHIRFQHISSPRMDVAELKNKIEVTAELPGMTADDVKLTCENNILTLSGEKNLPLKKKIKIII